MGNIGLLYVIAEPPSVKTRYIGCYSKSGWETDIFYRQLTVEMCIEGCKTHNFTFAAVQVGVHCARIQRIYELQENIQDV